MGEHDPRTIALVLVLVLVVGIVLEIRQATRLE